MPIKKPKMAFLRGVGARSRASSGFAGLSCRALEDPSSDSSSLMRLFRLAICRMFAVLVGPELEPLPVPGPAS